MTNENLEQTESNLRTNEGKTLILSYRDIPKVQCEFEDEKIRIRTGDYYRKLYFTIPLSLGCDIPEINASEFEERELQSARDTIAGIKRAVIYWGQSIRWGPRELENFPIAECLGQKGIDVVLAACKCDMNKKENLAKKINAQLCLVGCNGKGIENLIREYQTTMVNKK